ncbi:MAG: T9SS type A sorting domain-containing protein [Flavobacteriales bacterium]|nr:T9SS type A sorting domain-containing protein [Flavobacteriales bacterium]MBP9080645.1 T9SS type A sorting domain-containing protein [Flavobacteriales bacterium]
MAQRISRAHFLPSCFFLLAAQVLHAQDTILVPCDQGSLGGTYCYTDNDDHTWLWYNGCGEPLPLQFLSGTIETSPSDNLRIYDGMDGTAPLLYQNAAGSATVDLAGLQFVGTSGYLYMEMSSNATNCCATDGLLPTDAQWEWTWLVGDGTVGLGAIQPIGFSMYPNPATGHLTLRLPGHRSGPVELRILNALGSVVLADHVANTGDEARNVDLRSLPMGSYCVVLSTPEGEVAQRLQVLH